MKRRRISTKKESSIYESEEKTDKRRKKRNERLHVHQDLLSNDRQAETQGSASVVRPLLGCKDDQEVQPTSIPVAERGVVLVNRLPHGFTEAQIKRFFSQFGTVTRMRLVRSKKTGNSKGYAFVEFDLKDIASIVAEAVNNYIMFGVVIRCRFLPQDKVPQGVFTNYRKRIRRGWNVSLERKKHNIAELTEAKVRKTLRKYQDRNAKLKKLGLNIFFNLKSESPRVP